MDDEKPNDEARKDDSHEFAKEEELREEHDHEVLGGCDLEHCQRMRG